MAKKKQAAAGAAPLTVGHVLKTANVTFAPRKGRETEYRPILDAMANLSKGETLPIPVPNGVTVEAFQNRLNAAIRRFKPVPAKGCTFSKRVLEDGRIGVSCVAAE